MDDKYISVKEYSEKKGISVQAVYQSIWRKSVEHKKIGTLTLVKDE
jgi:hypothetical protein